MKQAFYIFLATLLIIAISCRKNRDKPSWDTNMLMPLMQSSLSIENIIKDTSLVKNTDNSISLVNRVALANLTLDSLVTISTPPYKKTTKVTSLVLDTRRDTTKISLGRIANELLQGDITQQSIGQFIIDNHNQVLPFLPGFSLSNLGPYDLDVQQFFQSANILTGNLTIEVKNGLPIEINTVDFEIRNKINNHLIVDQNFNNILPNTSQTITESLAGKQVEGVLKAILNTLSLNSGSGILIDTSDAIEVILTISDVTVSEATAIFPAQNIVNSTEKVILQDMKDVQLTYAKLAKGKVKIEVVSTAQDNVYINYQIPSAIKDGIHFETNVVIPPAPPGGNSVRNYEYDMSGYEMDLTGQHHDTVNTFYNSIVGRIEYTGNVVHLSLRDSFDVKIYTEGLVPSYVKGYLGRDTIMIGPGSKSLSLFDRIESGTINFQSTQIKLQVENGMGFNGIFKVNEIQSRNHKTNTQRTLSGGIINTDIAIAKATDNPFTPVNTTVDLSGSNAVELINILPSAFNYNVMVVTNPTGNDNTYSDFAYNTSSIKANLDIELPLSLFASQLTLADTIDFVAPKAERQSVKGGVLTLIVNNAFPLDASLRLYFLDGGGMIMDSLISSDIARAAPLGSDMRTTGKTKSTIHYVVSEQRMQALYRFSKVLVKVKFSTHPPNTHLKIYSDYSIDFKLVGDFSYNVQIR